MPCRRPSSLAWICGRTSATPGPANAAASALAADLSGEPWRHYHGPVVVCGVELGEAGEEYAVDLTGDRLAALRRRLGRHSAE
ncbi:hypothetical protein FDA94_30305 [Herbidospora galbida]|uniref:Uncharacterized protein n=1 Tax=Herbidospora galbida TaxID=2575442 RepID=A0A4U3M7P1_9ACTN|nr:hypothetical protein [Herbidospora galbida]TKK84219.1 hypothetical protein FDA94_30305 [Herbidospora galbida]